MLKSNAIKLFNLFGGPHISRWLNKDNTVVLMYHGVVDDRWPFAEKNWLQVKVSKFRKQMEYLKQHYDVVSIDQVNDKRKSNKPRAVITFDDGYENNYTVAYPILRELGLPATIYVVTGTVDTNHIFWYDRLWLCGLHQTIDGLKDKHPREIELVVDEMILPHWTKLLTNNEFNILQTFGPLKKLHIEEMSNSGLITFGSHTHKHEIVTRISFDEFKYTFLRSLEILKSWNINISNSFCFPNGWFDESHVKYINSSGIEYIISVGGGAYTSQHSRIVPRFGVGRPDEMASFKTDISNVQKYWNIAKRLVLSYMR